MRHAKKIQVSVFLLILILSGTGWCGKIIYPWRVTTAIVLPGENFEVWLDADKGQNVNSVHLLGPYNTVNPEISIDTNDEGWEYDADSRNTFNTKITVTVPADAPAERYDIVLKTSTGDETSFGGVKVVKEYKSSYYIMHISDAHRWHKFCENGDIDQSWTIMKELDAIIKTANIIDPEIFIESGDNIYNPDHQPEHEHGPASTEPVMGYDWSIEDSWQGGYPFAPLYLKGTADLNAAAFAVAGNHDAPGHNFDGKNRYDCAVFYNTYYGVQSFNFTYGNTRFSGVNNGWYSLSDPLTQSTAAVNWINSIEDGNLNVAIHHVADWVEIKWFYEAMKNNGTAPDLMLCGHYHQDYKSNPHLIDGRKIEYFAPGIRDNSGGAFNLYNVDDIAGTYEAVGEGKTGSNKALSIDNVYTTNKLSLDYFRPNNGSVTENTAILVNKFGFPIEGARVRFVMPKGNQYYVSPGTIMQQFDGDQYCIVDASVDVGANSTTAIEIIPIKELEHNLFAVRQTSQLENLPAYTSNHSPEFIVWNIGESEELNVPVHCEISSEDEIVYSETKTIDKIGSFEKTTVAFANWNASNSNRYDITFYTDLLNDQDKSSDTLKSSITVSNLLDGFESDFSKWTSNGSWGQDNQRANNGVYCMAVSPGMRYEDNTDSYSMYNYSFNLASTDNPELTFWSLNILASGDSGFLEISVDQGNSWERLGDAFSGLSTEWMYSHYSLKKYKEYDDIRFRFHFISDGSKTHLGWFIDDVKIEDGLTVISGEEAGKVINNFELFNNYPNPFNPETVISYHLAAGSRVSLTIYDILGHEIKTLVNERQNAGKHSVTFNASGLASGFYIYKLKAASFEQSRKMLLLR